MKIRAAVAILALAFPVGASAQWSTTVRLGAVKSSDVQNGLAGFEDPIAFKTGWEAGVGLSYALPNGFSVEGEIGYLRAPVKTDGGVPISGDFTEWLFMGNGYYHFAPMGAVRPFVGVGLGAARVQEKFNVFDNDTNLVFFQRDRTRSSFAYQARIGAAFDVGGMNASIGYRYLHVKDTEFNAPDGVLIKTEALRHHVLEFGLTF